MNAKISGQKFKMNIFMASKYCFQNIYYLQKEKE